MGFKATERPMGGGGSKIPALDPGTYPARVVGVALIGMHSSSYEGVEKPPMENLAITYELLDEFLMDDDDEPQLDKPRFLTENFPFHNLLSERATSTKRYNTLDPLQEHGGDWSLLLGTPCMLDVKETLGKGKNLGRVFNKIANVAPMRAKEAAKAGPLVNTPTMFDFNEPTKEAWDKANGAVKGMARRALNFKGSPMEAWDAEAPTTPAAEEEKKAPPKNSLKAVREEEKNGVDW